MSTTATQTDPLPAHEAGSGMVRFEQRSLREAIAHAAVGGQALHLMSGRFAYMRPTTPGCFKGWTVIAHLFDQSAPRLASTARRLGVRVVKIERAGEPGQHIDLCGRPLERAMAECSAATPANLLLLPNADLTDAARPGAGNNERASAGGAR